MVISGLLKSLGINATLKDNTIEPKSLTTIRSVRIMGVPESLHTFKRTITSFLNGKPYSSESLKSVKQILSLKLKSLGYRDAKVIVRTLRTKQGYVLTIKVNLNRLYTVKSIEVHAENNGTRKLAYEKFKNFIGKPFNTSVIEKSVDGFECYLVNIGYFNAIISYSFLRKKGKINILNERPVNLIVNIKEGRRYRIELQGIKSFKRNKISKLLTFKTSRSLDSFEIEQSRKNILNFYKNHGFPYANVIVEKSDNVLTFIVREGKFIRIKRIIIKPNLDVKEPQKFIDKPFSASRLKDFIDNIKLKLENEGYINAKLNYKIKDSELVILIEKGKRYEIGKVIVKGDILDCFKRMRIPKYYSQEAISLLRSNLITCYQSRGYLDCLVNIKQGINGSRVNLDVSIKPGEPYRFGFVLVRGLRRTKLRYIKKFLVIKPGSTYSADRISKQYAILSSSKLFSRINISEVKTENVINELITLSEGSKVRLGGFFGYGIDSGLVTNGITTSSSPFGYGMRYSIFGNYRQKQGYNSVIKVEKPAFPWRNYTTSFNISKKEEIYKSFKTYKLTYTLSTSRKVAEHMLQTFGIRISREKPRDTSIAFKKATLERSVFVSETYDKRDSIVDPKGGYLLSLRGSYVGKLLGGSTSYYTLESDAVYIVSPFKKISIASRISVGTIEPFSHKEIPVQDRFFLGGAESIRGYAYGTISPRDDKGNYIGGKSYGMFSVEQRYRVSKHIQLATFYDAGNVFPNDIKFNPREWYSSIGIGLRYMTSIGPLRIDYGYKLKKLADQGPGRIHISFGFPF